MEEKKEKLGKDEDAEKEKEPKNHWLEFSTKENSDKLVKLEPAGKLEKLSPLERYLLEARRHPVLSAEEELSLALSFREKKDIQSAQKLVLSNLRLVVKIAFEYQRHWMDLFDLIQEGNIGLLQAVRKFDPYRGIRFSTYASFWIRAYILKFLMENLRLVKIGTTQAQRRLFFNLRKEKEKLEAQGFKPSLSLLAENLQVDEEEVQEMDTRLSNPEQSLEAPIGNDSAVQGETVGSKVADESLPIDEKIAEQEFKTMVKDKLREFRENLEKSQNEKELYIFDNRLLAQEPETLQEIGRRFNISRERVRQLENRLRKRLRDYLKSQLPELEDKDFLDPSL